MKICVLASGSKCNASYLETNNKKILIDFGTSLKYNKEKLYELGIEDEKTNEVSTMLLTGIGTKKDKLEKLKFALKKISRI